MSSHAARIVLAVAGVATIIACNAILGLEGDTLVASPDAGSVEASDTDAEEASTDASPDATPPSGQVRLVTGALGGCGYSDGPLAEARFRSMRGIARDNSGALYVTDHEASIIRRIDPASGVVTTLAGADRERGVVNGAYATARFKGPSGIVFDGSENLYVSDQEAHQIRRINLRIARVDPVLGLADLGGLIDGDVSQARFARPRGLAFDRAAQKLYVADSDNKALRVISFAPDGGTATVTTACAPTASCNLGSINAFTDVVFDTVAHRLVARTSAPRILAIDLPPTTVSTLAGGASSGHADGAAGAALFDLLGVGVYPTPSAIMVGDFRWLRRVDRASGLVSTVAGDGGAGYADGVPGAFENITAITGEATSDTVVVTDGCAVRLVEPAGIRTLAGRPRQRGSVDGPRPTARLGGVRSQDFDGDHTVYIYDDLSCTLRALDLETEILSTIVGSPGQCGTKEGVGAQAGLNDESDGIVYDGQGHVFISDGPSAVVHEVDVATKALKTLPATRGLGRATARGPNGKIFWADQEVGEFVAPDRFKVLAGDASKAPAHQDGVGSAARFASVSALCFDASRNAIFLSDETSHTVRRIDVATGETTTIAGKPSEAGSSDGVGEGARFRRPSGVACDGQGSVFVADTGNATLRRLDLTSRTVTTIAGTLGQSGISPGPLPARINEPLHPLIVAPKKILVASRMESALVMVELP